MCIEAGCNLELSTNLETPVYFSIVDAVKAGKLSESVVRETVKPLFYTRMRLGEFDPSDKNPYNFLDLSNIQSPAHRKLSLESAIKSFVLLKNKNGLPLDHVNVAAVVGPMANNVQQQFGDYSPDIDPSFTTTPLEGLRRLANHTQYIPGCNDNKCLKYNQTEIKAVVTGSDVIFVCLGTGQELESESNDRVSMDLPGHQLNLLQDVVMFSGKAKIILLLFNAGPLNITWAQEHEKVVAILECFFPAQSTGEALWRVITNTNANPGGRLPFTWYRYISQIPSMTSYTMEERTYRYLSTPPLYPFGYGLSYTQFHYDQIWHKPYIQAGDNLEIRVQLSNLGMYDGDEVVQVYIQWLTINVTMPMRQLVAYERIFVPARTKSNLTLVIQAVDMAIWQNSSFVIQPGKLKLTVGGQQPDQMVQVPSNILNGTFDIYGKNFVFR